jgi:4-amino-4-deoxy-L-arabinose transferase-like glycosyltransferase
VRPWPWVVSLVCVLVALVFFGRNLDFSAYAHPDEPGKIAQIVEGRHNFNHPLLMLNSVRFLTGALGKSQDAEFVKLAGRWSSVVFSSLAVGLLVLVAGRLHGRFVAAAAGVFLITNPMLFQLSHFFKEDPALLFGLSLTLVAMLVFSSSRRAPAAVFLGVASACAVSGKYAGALIIPFSIYIIFVCSENRRRDLAAMLLACGVAFFLINLPAFTNQKAASQSLQKEIDLLTGARAHKFLTPVPHRIYGRIYFESSTPILAGLLLAYGFGLLKRGFRLSPNEWVLIIWPVFYVGLLAFQTRPFDRYLLPAAAILACLSAAGLSTVLKLKHGTVLAVLLVALSLAWQVPRLHRADRGFKQDKPRILLIPTPNDCFDPIPRRENKTAKHAKPRSFFLT